jgi:hypothetical protein
MMASEDKTKRREELAQAFNQHESRSNGAQVVSSLCYGLRTLRNLLFTRVHEDVERNFGRDSMVVSFSMLKCEEQTRLEIDVFQVAVSTAEAQSRGYVKDVAWFADWLKRLRLEPGTDTELVQQRLARYLELSSEERRVAFSRVLERTFPEATRAPLVLYRLLPLGISIATALAFGDQAAAQQLRGQQINWLPSITDCHECRGQLLENGEQCATCSNPLWSYDWLNAAG